MRRRAKIADHGLSPEVLTARPAAGRQSRCARLTTASCRFLPLPAVSRRFPPFPAVSPFPPFLRSRLPTRRRACYLGEEIPWKIRGEVR